jgi:hypothetical protein
LINVLLQTTIEASSDDWSVDRFSYLRDFLSGVLDDEGNPSFTIIARNREKRGAPDSVLSNLRRSDFDEVWLFAVDAGDGLTIEDCQGIAEFRKLGRGLMVTRDHMDLGCSVCGLGGVGAAHHFHSKNMDPDKSRRAIDDRLTTYISWPNYHSGANGDFQLVKAVGKPHPVLFDPSSATGLVRYLPSHPHEGSVSAPPRDSSARVILEGQSAASGANFNLAVAFEQSEDGGRAIAQSTFHHFTDFNWVPAAGSPSFVTELPGDAIERTPAALESTKRYVRNLAFWLANREVKADV